MKRMAIGLGVALFLGSTARADNPYLAAHVATCVKAVHDQVHNDSFDAFVDVPNHTTMWGDKHELFLFHKCMTQLGETRDGKD